MSNRNRDFYAGCLLFLIAFGLFVKTSCPVVFVGDSGELTAASFVLGVAHPSGYPLYVMLCRAAQFMPLDSVCARSNLLSALATAIAAIYLYKILRQLSIKLHLAGLVCLFLILSKTIWIEATVARVYGLNLMFMLILIHLALFKDQSLKKTLIFWLFCGLALSNHIQSLFTVLPAGLLVFFRGYSSFRIRHLGMAALFVLFGLSCYLQMPVRSITNPPMDWRNPETFDSFFASISRKDYWQKSTGFSMELVQDEIVNLASILERQYPFWLIVLCGIGWLVLLVLNPGFACIALITAAGNILMLTKHGSQYDIFETDRYHIPFIASYLIGLGGIARLLSIRFRTPIRYLIVCVVCLATPLLPLRHYYYGDRSSAFIADDLVFNIQALLPHGASIFLYADGELFSMVCLQLTDRFRDDLTIIDRTGNMFEISHPLSGLQLKNSPDRAVVEESIIARNPHFSYCSFILNASEMRRFTPIPHGLIYRFVPIDWKIQPVPGPPKYARNRLMTEYVKSDFMVQLIINEMYIAGARSFFEFENLIRTARYFSTRLENGSGNHADASALAEIYSRANLAGGVTYYRKLADQMQELLNRDMIELQDGVD